MSLLTVSDARVPSTRSIPPTSANILFVEDDDRIAQEVMLALIQRGHHVDRVADGLRGFEAAVERGFDIIVTDRMLPGIDGLEMIDRLRGRGIDTPILVLSAIGTALERVRGLRAGGDDYLAKPFDLEELAARIEVLLRRSSQTRETMIRVGPLVMDLLERTVQRDGRLIDLLPREFKLLEYMMRRPEQALTRAMLLQEVWHYRYAAETNLVDVHVGKLRRKLTVAGECELIVTVHGAGFMLVRGEAAGRSARCEASL